MKQLLKLFITTLLLTSAVSVKAAIVSLDPSSPEILVGEQLTLDVLYDFEDEVISGGGFSITFDNSAFNLVSFGFDGNLGDDVTFRTSPTTPFDGDAFDLAFGSAAPLNNAGKVGTLIFENILQGSFDFVVSDPIDDDISSIFRNRGSQVNAQVTVTSDVNPVPLPGAVWLFMSGFAGLGLIRQRKHSS